MKNFAFGTKILGELRQGEQKYLLRQIIMVLYICIHFSDVSRLSVKRFRRRRKIGALLQFSLKVNLFPVGIL